MIADTVLLVTASYDAAPEYVARALDRRGVPYFRLDTDRFPNEVQLSFDPSEGITITDCGRSISANEIRSVWYRRNVAPILPKELEFGPREFCERETRAFLEGALRAIPTDRWLSSPEAIWRAEKKPYHLAVAAKLGFTIPPTIITNHRQYVKDFARGRNLVAKAVSSGYIQHPEGFHAIFTNALGPEDLADLSGLTLAPVTFQERIEKSSDIRVTVIGDSVFAAEILSQNRESSITDWRATDDPDLEHVKHQLPSDLADKCRKLVKDLGIRFGAIDFALTPDGNYVFFEINPNGEWLWIEDQLEYPIADTIAAWLSMTEMDS